MLQNPNNKDLKILQDSQDEIEELLEEKNKAIIFRTKTRWYELGEKNSKFFFNLEKSRYNARVCTKIITDNGNELTDPGDILQEQHRFYQKLYRSDTSITFEIKNNTNIKITDSDKNKLDQPISIQEVDAAVKQMKRNKSPGICGFTSEFYQFFWSKLRDLIFEAITYMYDNGSIPDKLKKGVINLIPKQNKDTRKLAFLRPITLLCLDYKLIEKILANRMLESLEYIISQNQQGFMRNRHMAVNIPKLFDLIAFAERNDLEAIILSLDFQKCFDLIEKSAIIGSLNFFNYPNYIIKWIDMLYTDFTAVVQNNRHFTQQMNVEKFVHQGGCISSILFLICAEVLAIELRNQNKTILGIPVNQIENLLGQFADDMDIYLLYHQETLNHVFDILEKFKK